MILDEGSMKRKLVSFALAALLLVVGLPVRLSMALTVKMLVPKRLGVTVRFKVNLLSVVLTVL